MTATRSVGGAGTTVPRSADPSAAAASVAMVAIIGGAPEVRGSARGIGLGVASMLPFTGYYLINRLARSTTPISPMEWMSGVTLFAGLLITPIALATCSLDDYRQLGGADWLY